MKKINFVALALVFALGAGLAVPSAMAEKSEKHGHHAHGKKKPAASATAATPAKS